MTKPYFGYVSQSALTKAYIGYGSPYIGYAKPYIGYARPYIGYFIAVHRLWRNGASV